MAVPEAVNTKDATVNKKMIVNFISMFVCAGRRNILDESCVSVEVRLERETFGDEMNRDEMNRTMRRC